MTSLEYADRILGELLNGKIAESVSNCDGLECMIACTDGSVIRVTGYLVSEIAKRIESTDNATPYMSPSAIEDVT